MLRLLLILLAFGMCAVAVILVLAAMEPEAFEMHRSSSADARQETVACSRSPTSLRRSRTIISS